MNMAASDNDSAIGGDASPSVDAGTTTARFLWQNESACFPDDSSVHSSDDAVAASVLACLATSLSNHSADSGFADNSLAAASSQLQRGCSSLSMSVSRVPQLPSPPPASRADKHPGLAGSPEPPAIAPSATTAAKASAASTATKAIRSTAVTPVASNTMATSSRQSKPRAAAAPAPPAPSEPAVTYRQKRQRNNEAVRKCRIKKKQQIEERERRLAFLEARVLQLEVENTSLRDQLQRAGLWQPARVETVA